MALAPSAGGFVFGIAAGLAIIRGGTLPTWLGWAAIVIGVVAVTPAVILALPLFALWAAVVGVVIWRRSPPVAVA